MTEVLLTPAEACERLSVTTPILHRWEKEGRLTPVRRLGGHRRYRESEIYALAGKGALLSPAQVATMFGVDPKTVMRWAIAGKLTYVRTLGGHRRFYEREIRALLATKDVIIMLTPAEVRARLSVSKNTLRIWERQGRLTPTRTLGGRRQYLESEIASLAGEGSLLSPAQISATYDVHPRTISRWAKAGELRFIKTPGGHRRFYEAEVHALLAGNRRPLS